MISSWIDEKPSRDLLKGSSTFVLENDSGIALFCLTIYFTNCKEIAFIENFAGNPEMKEERKNYSQLLFTYLEKLARDMGYKSVVCFSGVDKLTKKYEEFGYTKIMSNLDCLGKAL